MSTNAFDTLAAARELEASGIERPQAEAIAKTMRAAAGADRGELYRALWIQAAALIGVQIAIATIIVTLLSR